MRQAIVFKMIGFVLRITCIIFMQIIYNKAFEAQSDYEIMEERMATIAFEDPYQFFEIIYYAIIFSMHKFVHSVRAMLNHTDGTGQDDGIVRFFGMKDTSVFNWLCGAVMTFLVALNVLVFITDATNIYV
jgi:hypothetical protein